MGVRGKVATLCAAVATSTLAACGSGPAAGPPVVDWFVAPARANEATLARECAVASSGAYRVRVHELPVDADQRHTDLVRRLSADNDSVDVVAVDTASIAELADAGYLARFTQAQQSSLTEGSAPGAVAAGTVDGRLVAAPWWFDPQLLFYRGVAAERAGLDVTKPIFWDDLIGGADRLGTSVQVTDPDGSGTASWVSALTTAADGAVVSDQGTPLLDSGEVRAAASLVEFYRESQIGPGPSPTAVADFAGAGGGFLVAPSSTISDPALQAVSAEVNVVAYPVVVESGIAPGSGVSLAIARDARDPRAAAALIECLRSESAQRSLVVATGHGATRLATYEDPTVQQDSPTAEVVAAALAEARDVPPADTWTQVRRAIDDTWSPLSSVSIDTTPERSQRAAEALIAGRLP